MIRACAVYETTTLGHYSHDQDKDRTAIPAPEASALYTSQTTRTNTPRWLQDQVWHGLSLQHRRTETPPPTVAHMPGHVDM
jgi:hypothetical protein